MLVPQTAQWELDGRQGSRAASLSELRRQLAEPTRIQDGHRQRLLDLVCRLARVQALGGEYARVAFSDAATAALKRLSASV
ncbi:MAG TPA: hypothetical protein DCX07_10235 [Phycisphaerales bacterium]|nr:hypothetical protein [Phycisphaerales bacterium]